MSDLRECPFCGGEATIFKVGRWYRISVNHSDECILSHTDFDCPQTEDFKSELIEDWNNRTSTPNAKIQRFIDDRFYCLDMLDPLDILDDLKAMISDD